HRHRARRSHLLPDRPLGVRDRLPHRLGACALRRRPGWWRSIRAEGIPRERTHLVSRTILDMSISVDGFIAGPNETIDNGLGDGGQRLHDWVLPRDADGRFLESGPTGVDAEMMAAYQSVGASVAGPGTVDPAGGWGG